MAGKNTFLDHNISCDMDMVNEFSEGVSGLFMNAQDILSESQGILRSIEGIVESIPVEARYAGLIDSIHGCLSKIRMCDMGAIGFQIIGKTNNYVENMYSIDREYADLIKEHTRLCSGLINNTAKITFGKLSPRFKIGTKKRDFLLLSADKFIPSINRDMEEKELLKKIDKMQYYGKAYTHVQDQKARDYYQRKMNEYFSNELRPILGKKIDTTLKKMDEMNNKESIEAWHEVKEIVQACKFAKTYQSLCEGLELDVNVIIAALMNNKTILPEVEKVKKICIGLNQLHELSDEYFQWLCIAESVELIPYRCKADNDDAQKAKTVTLGIGFTFDINGTHWKELEEVLGWTELDIRNVINIVYNNEEVDEKYIITEEQAKQLFEKTSDKYIENVNYNVEMYNSRNDEITFYSQNEFEAMFDYAYNNGLGEKSNGVQYRDDDKYIIYYYLRKDQENGVIAIIEQSEGKEDLGTKRRLNQMNLFFEKDYNYVDNNQLDELREKLGFYDN